jgi:hypothetical protein
MPYFPWVSARPDILDAQTNVYIAQGIAPLPEHHADQELVPVVKH